MRKAGQVYVATLGIPQNYQAEDKDGFDNFGNTSIHLGGAADERVAADGERQVGQG